MHRLHPTAGRAGVAAGLLATVVVAGCTSSKGGTNSVAPTSPGASTSSSSTSPKSSASTSKIVNGGLPAGVTQGPLPSSVANNIVKRKSVTISKCQSTANGYQSGGTVTNSGTEERTYHITVFFTTTQATVLSYGRTTVTVAKGATKNWTASAKFKAPKSMLCVLRGVG